MFWSLKTVEAISQYPLFTSNFPMSSVFVYIGLLCLLQKVNSLEQCGKNEINFLGKCFCEPGWESKSATVQDCTVPIMENGFCECEYKDLDRLFLKNDSWFHPSVSFLVCQKPSCFAHLSFCLSCCFAHLRVIIDAQHYVNGIVKLVLQDLILANGKTTKFGDN